jgi:tripartite ATP-independent transporter DctP family solute receptor
LTINPAGSEWQSMKHLSRRQIMPFAASVLAAPLIARYAHAAEVNWRIAHVAPLDTPLHRRLVEAADAIGKRSNGQMEVTVIGEGRAGIQSGLLAQVKNGGLEMVMAAGGQLASTMPLCSIPAIGFLFRDYASLWSAIDGDLGQLIRPQIKSQLGVEVLDKIWDFGFRQITTSTRPIQIAGDMAGLKIRTQIDVDQMDLFRALGAIPIVITLPYLHTALEHHQIDGQESVLPLVEYARLNEVQSFCSMTRHVWDGLWLCINGTAWSKLPDRLQRIVVNTLNGSAQHQRDDSAAMEDTIRVSLGKGGLKFIDVEPGSFRDALRTHGHYAEIRKKLGDQAWDVIQRTTGVTA